MTRLTVLFPLLSAIAVRAQVRPDSLTVAKVPVTVKAVPGKNRWLKPALALSYSGAVYLMYKKEDAHIQHESQEGKNPFEDRLANTISPLGLGKTNWIACGATAGFAYLSIDTRLQRTAVLWAGSLALNSVATNSLKSYFQRYRPNTGLPFNSFDGANGSKKNRSFPSAHTSTAFATATVFATQYKDKKWVAPFAYGMASMVGLSRVYNNAHWASDVMAGAAVGFLSAKAIIGVDKLLRKKYIQIYPQPGPHTSVTMVYTFHAHR